MLSSMQRGLLKSLLVLSILTGASQVWAQGGLVGPPNQILCNKTATLSPTSINSVFSLVPGVTNTNVFICGWHFTTQSAATTQSFQILQGPSSTGTPCGAGTGSSGMTSQTLTPSLSVSGTAPSADHIDYATIQTSLTGQQICVGVQNGSNISGVVYFSQF